MSTLAFQTVVDTVGAAFKTPSDPVCDFYALQCPATVSFFFLVTHIGNIFSEDSY